MNELEEVREHLLSGFETYIQGQITKKDFREEINDELDKLIKKRGE